MTASQHTRSASPATLLREWHERADGAPLHEALFLGLRVDLPSLERNVVPAARALSARVAVFGDGAQGPHDPAGVRTAGRDYLHAPVVVAGGSLRAALVVLIGEHACRIAVGGGDAAHPGWDDDALWTVVETDDDASHAVVADVADWLENLAGDDAVAMAPWAAARLEEIAGLLAERHILAPDPVPGAAPVADARLLDSGAGPLLAPVPTGPVDALHAYTPSARTLGALIARLDPRHVTLTVHENWSELTADALRTILAGRPHELRVRPEQPHRQGKFALWRQDGGWTALTGEPVADPAAPSTGSRDARLALLHDSAEPAPAPADAVVVTLADLDALRGDAVAVAPVVVGARADTDGLCVVLAEPAPASVAVFTSADGSPGSWRELGTIGAGASSTTFAPAAGSGPVVRATLTRPDGTLAESAAVFAYSPAAAARPSTERLTPGPRTTREDASVRAEPAPAPAAPRPAPTTRATPPPAPPARPAAVVPPAPSLSVAPPLPPSFADEPEPVADNPYADGPYAEAVEELAEHGWAAHLEHGLWRITGSFGNPVPIAAVAATRLARVGGPVLMQSGNSRRWAFMAWAAPDLTLLNWPARNWRSYQVRPPADPESRFRGGDLASVPGRVGPLNRQIGDPPPALLRVLADTGIEFVDLIKTLQDIGD